MLDWRERLYATRMRSFDGIGGQHCEGADLATRSLSRLAPQYLIAVRDDEGRPLGENRPPPEARAGVSMETTPCPYPGSRLNHPNPMNVSALRQMRRHWDAVKGYLDELTALHTARSGGSTLVAGDLWRIAKLAECAPQFLLFRHREPLGAGTLPGSVAALYKIALGLKYALHWHVESSVADEPADSPVDAAGFLEYVERRHLFVGPHQVCAGPAALIVEVIERITGQGAAAPTPRLRERLGDVEGFFDYAAIPANFDLADASFRIASLDRLMFIYESLRGVQAGWQGDYHALAWLFEHVNTALAAAGDDYFLADLAVTSARTRTRMIDALSRLITDPISAEWGGDHVRSVRAVVAPCGPPAAPVSHDSAPAPVREGLDPGITRQLLAMYSGYVNLERRFVDCIAVTDAALEQALGDATARPPRAAARAEPPTTPCSVLLETIFGSTIDSTGRSSTRQPAPPPPS